MIIDNFNLIKPLFYFNESNNMFFHCQVITRKKDNNFSNKVIKSYLILSKEHLESLKEEIILLCKYFNARAYINILGKDFGDVNKALLATISNTVVNNTINCLNPLKIFNKVVGSTTSRLSRFIIDIDNLSLKDSILEWLDEYFNCNKMDSSIKFLYATIPTVNGVHLITKPFDREKFSNIFPSVDVHKNSMGTLLYYDNNQNL